MHTRLIPWLSLCGRPPRLGGASNLVENQINLAAGRRTLSRLFPPPLLGLAPSRLRPPPACPRPSPLDDTSKSKERDWEEGGEGGGAEVLHATDTDLEARREGGAATKSFRLLAATRPGPYLSRSVVSFHQVSPPQFTPRFTFPNLVKSHLRQRERETERELWKKNDEGGGKKRKRGLNSNVDAFDASAVERINRGENRQVWIRGEEGYAICKSLNVRIKYPSLSYPTRSFKSPLVEMRWAAGRLVERLPSNATYRVIRQESEPRALIFARLSYL